MLYARVVVGLPVEGPFDYIVPPSIRAKIKSGSRVWVSFGTRKLIGYVVNLSGKTNIKNLKTLTALIDDVPVLDKHMLRLTRLLSLYYCCSWGEAIETAIPESLRKGVKIPAIDRAEGAKEKDIKTEPLLIQDLDGQARWDTYVLYIKEALDNKTAVIVLMPDVISVLAIKDKLAQDSGMEPLILYRKQPKELDAWLKIAQTRESGIVIGTRSAVFAPVKNLGLMIIEEESNMAYKQDQVPHYHAREVALMRVNIERARLILGATSPSLESLFLARTAKLEYIFMPRKRPFPRIKMVNAIAGGRRNKALLSKYLQDYIASTLNSQGKILLFLNRKGFATFASCMHCGISIRCPRCNLNLVYHFKDNILSCHYCNFRISPPKICPNCNSGYIKYSGLGTEKLESELSRLFPQAKIVRLDDEGAYSKEADIFIATQAIFKKAGASFSLTCVISIDNSLNHIDFRSTEKTFGLLLGLLNLTEKELIIQTALVNHHLFQALLKHDPNLFYEEELKQRRELKFPPYRHMILVKLRGKSDTRVREATQILFEKLLKSAKGRGVKVSSWNRRQPEKLRGNFYWQVLLFSQDARQASNFLKIYLKDFSHSGIIVTVDVDPV